MGKGYILTISTLLLVSVLLLFSSFYLGRNSKIESALNELAVLEKGGFVSDDISFDLNKLLETSAEVQRINQNLKITFSDRLPSDLNKRKELLNCQNFLRNVYAKQQNATISTDLNKLLDGKTELFFSNGLEYDFNYAAGDGRVSFYFPNGNTDAGRMDINISVNASSVLVEPWVWNPAGDMNVNLYYRDSNSLNTVNYSGKVDSSILNTYRIHFSDVTTDELDILVGYIEENKKAFALWESIDNASSKAELVFSAFVPAADVNSLNYYYNADFNYSQFDLNLNGKIFAGKA